MPPDAALEELPRFISPMLATAGPAPTHAGWAFEVKWDGMRAQLRYDGRRVRVCSRTRRDCTDEFPELAAIADQLAGRRVILDGELVCLDAEGKPDFAALRSRLGRPPGRRSGRVPPATLIIFDGLHVGGRAARQLPYEIRRELLGSLELDGSAWRTPRRFVGQAQQLLAATAAQGLEGVVAKRLDVVYREGRSRSWVKHKHRRRERLVVSGWRERDGELPEFLLARPGLDGRLRPAGSASLGLDAGQRAELLEALAAREVPGRARRSRVRWASSGVEVVVDAHGSPSGPVRDAVVRSFEVSPAAAWMSS